MTTFLAPPASGAVAIPSYVSGRWYPSGTGANASAVAINTLYAHPMLISRTLTVQGIAAYCSTLSAGNAKLGIYADNGSTAPGALIAENNADLSTGATGAVAGVFTANPTLTPGLYWLASCFSATPTMYASRGDSPISYFNAVSVYGSDTAGNAFAGWFALSRALTYAAASQFFPATFGAPTFSAGANSPIIALRAA